MVYVEQIFMNLAKIINGVQKLAKKLQINKTG